MITPDFPEAAAHWRRELITRVGDDGERVTVADLAERFRVMAVSIRRGLRLLEDAGRLLRVRGGAVAPSAVRVHGVYAQKVRENRDEKGRIGAAAVALVRPSDVVVFDSGSTVEQVVAHVPATLRRGNAITGVTNSAPVIREISTWSSPQMVCLGGLYLPDYEALVGPQTIADLRDLSADLALIDCDWLTVETGLTTSHVLVAEVAATMASHARRVVVVADSTKLGRRGFTPIVPLSAIHVLVTDDQADPSQVKRMREMGIEVILA